MLNDVDLIIDHAIEKEAEDFAQWIGDDGADSLIKGTAPTSDWEAMQRRLFNDSNDTKARDWLAVHSEGHIYTNFMRACILQRFEKQLDPDNLLKFLGLVQYTLNMIPNTDIGHDMAEDSYAVARIVDDFVNNMKTAQELRRRGV